MAEILSKIVNPKTKLRSSYWDNIKGVLIILVVFAHYLAGYRAKIQIAAAIICTLLIIAVFGNDFVSKNVNAFIRNCARSISFTSQQETKKEKAYKAITLSIICITFIAPIVIKFIRLSA